MNRREKQACFSLVTLVWRHLLMKSEVFVILSQQRKHEILCFSSLKKVACYCVFPFIITPTNKLAVVCSYRRFWLYGFYLLEKKVSQCWHVTLLQLQLIPTSFTITTAAKGTCHIDW